MNYIDIDREDQRRREAREHRRALRMRRDKKKKMLIGFALVLVVSILLIPQLTIKTNANDGYKYYTDIIIQPGDNLWKIANKFGIRVDDLINANNLTSNTLSIGQTLYIPGSNNSGNNNTSGNNNNNGNPGNPTQDGNGDNGNTTDLNGGGNAEFTDLESGKTYKVTITAGPDELYVKCVENK